MHGGTKIFCPKCKLFSVSKAVSPTKIGKPKAQRWYRTDFQDIAWFRRGRRCLSCGHEFLTAEVDEVFIDELVELRERLAEKQKKLVKEILKKASWLGKEEKIPLDLAENFIRSSAWWLTHSSGLPVRAPRHADRIYESHHGWAVDFGANTFLVGTAIERCRVVINNYIAESKKGRIPLREEIVSELIRQISGAVSNANGYEYSGYYPIDNEELKFGAQTIELRDAANFMIEQSCIEKLVLD